MLSQGLFSEVLESVWIETQSTYCARGSRPVLVTRPIKMPSETRFPRPLEKGE